MQLRDNWERFEQAKIGVVAIGQGSAVRTKEFQAQLEVPFPLLADPRRIAYRAYGLAKANLLREARVSNLVRGLRAAQAHGAEASKDQDMLQLGGIFVVGTDGIVRYAHPQQRMSDVPPNDELLAAVR